MGVWGRSFSYGNYWVVGNGLGENCASVLGMLWELFGEYEGLFA